LKIVIEASSSITSDRIHAEGTDVRLASAVSCSIGRSQVSAWNILLGQGSWL